MSLNPLRLPSERDLEHIVDPNRRREELDAMLGATASNLVRLANVAGERDSQQTFVMRLFRELSPERNATVVDLERVAKAVHDPEAFGLMDADDYLPNTQRRKLARKLKTLLDGPGANLFTGGQTLDLDQLCRPSVPGRTPLNVIYLNALPTDEQKQFFVASLATEIYRWMVSSLDSRGLPHLLFYLDEARDFIPAAGKVPVTKQPLIRLFTQGRKYGVACLLCTQSPRSVDYSVFGNCSTKMIGRLESTQDVDRVAEWFTVSESRPTWLNQRKMASTGCFIARWPEMPSILEGREVKVRPLYSLHEGAWSPARVEQEFRPELPPSTQSLRTVQRARAEIPVAERRL